MEQGLDKCEWDELWWLYCQSSVQHLDDAREMELENRTDTDSWYALWVKARPIRNGGLYQ